MIVTDATRRFVSANEKSNWNNKVDKVTGKTLSTNDFSNASKAKLHGIQSGANKYIHPSSHPAGMITQDANHRFISDTERTSWNNKVNAQAGKQLSTNDYTTADKSKLAGIQAGANRYVHPSSHSANMISQNATHRFVSDAEKNKWNSKLDRVSGKGLSTNDYTNADKNKLAKIEAEANKYVHPKTHSATEISTTANKQFVSQSEKDKWNAGQIPVGGIIMWSGQNVPKGWALCNGQTMNGQETPDLRGRFIVGSYPGKDNYKAGNSGGNVGNIAGKFTSSKSGSHDHSASTGKYKLTNSDIPAHSHEFKNYYCAARPDDDKRVGSSYGSDRIEEGIGSGPADYNNDNAYYRKMHTYSFGKGFYSRNAHSHSISSDGDHSHTLSVPYYVLAFIMRVK
jgi:hypothetical protein